MLLASTLVLASQINFVAINPNDQQAIEQCLGTTLQSALQAAGKTDTVQNVYGPEFDSDDGRTIYFVVETAARNYGLGLAVTGVNTSWQYSSFSGSVGPVGANYWEYQANAMSATGSLVEVSGSVINPVIGATVLTFNVASCWES